MKNILVFLLCLPGIGFASRARMYSLSQDPNRGANYVTDQRTVFGSAVDVNIHKNYMIMELPFESKEMGIDGEPELALKAQGGFFTEIGKFPIGIYLGQYTLLGLYDASLISTSTFMNNFIGPGEADPVNIFFGGDTGFQWGINLRYASKSETKQNGESKYQGIGLGVGLRKGIYEIYLNWKIQEDSDYFQGNESASLDNRGVDTGITISHKILTFYVEYINDQMRPEGDLFGFPTGDSDTKNFFIGVGKIFKITPTLNFYSNLDFIYFKSQAPINGQANSGKITTTKDLPLVIAAEYDAASWLTVRTSVRQTIFFGNTDIENNIDTSLSNPPGTTRVNMGGTLNFGKLKVDGNLGMDNVSLINFNAFFPNASFTYWY